MKKTSRLSFVSMNVFAAFLILVTSSFVFSLQQTDEELKKKYEAIIGDYEFDLADLGGGVQTLSFYVKEGELWADSGDGRPAILEPVEGQEFKFTATDPESGFFEITFLKDEQGKYTKCRVFIEDQDLEIEGIKIGG